MLSLIGTEENGKGVLTQSGADGGYVKIVIVK